MVCHASAWDIDLVDDLRIKMCIDITAEDFTTIHHELGHKFYQRAYGRLPVIFRDAANDGFHEAIGDTAGLSVAAERSSHAGQAGGLVGHRACTRVRPDMDAPELINHDEMRELLDGDEDPRG